MLHPLLPNALEYLRYIINHATWRRSRSKQLKKTKTRKGRKEGPQFQSAKTVHASRAIRALESGVLGFIAVSVAMNIGHFGRQLERTNFPAAQASQVALSEDPANFPGAQSWHWMYLHSWRNGKVQGIWCCEHSRICFTCQRHSACGWHSAPGGSIFHARLES